MNNHSKQIIIMDNNIIYLINLVFWVSVFIIILICRITYNNNIIELLNNNIEEINEFQELKEELIKIINNENLNDIDNNILYKIKKILELNLKISSNYSNNSSNNRNNNSNNSIIINTNIIKNLIEKDLIINKIQLLKSNNPSITNEEIRTILETTYKNYLNDVYIKLYNYIHMNNNDNNNNNNNNEIKIDLIIN